MQQLRWQNRLIVCSTDWNKRVEPEFSLPRQSDTERKSEQKKIEQSMLIVKLEFQWSEKSIDKNIRLILAIRSVLSVCFFFGSVATPAYSNFVIHTQIKRRCQRLRRKQIKPFNACVIPATANDRRIVAKVGYSWLTYASIPMYIYLYYTYKYIY